MHLGKTKAILFGSRPRLKSKPVLSGAYKGNANATNLLLNTWRCCYLEEYLSGANMATSKI